MVGLGTIENTGDPHPKIRGGVMAENRGKKSEEKQSISSGSNAKSQMISSRVAEGIQIQAKDSAKLLRMKPEILPHLRRPKYKFD